MSGISTATTEQSNKPICWLSVFQWTIHFLCRFGVFMLIWVLGCLVTDSWLQLSRDWLMTAGVVTFQIADYLSNKVEFYR